MNTIDTLADLIRADLTKCAGARQDWIDGTLALCTHLAEARTQFPNDQTFGHWLKENRFNTIGHQDRAAALNMARDLKLARTVLEETKRLSLQLIWSEEMKPRFTSPSKPHTTSSRGNTKRGPKTKTASAASRRGEAVRKLATAIEIIRPAVEAGEPLKTRELQEKHGISHVTFENASYAVEAEALLRRTPAAPKPEPEWRKPFKFPTAEETGMPVDGTLEELQAFHADYGRTPTGPKVATDSLRVKRVYWALDLMTKDDFPDARLFVQAIDVMLCHVPVPGKTNGMEKDHAAEGRRILNSVRKNLPVALRLLHELEAKLQTRKADGGPRLSVVG